MLSLFILPRRGLYQLTICKNCGYVWQCANCDAHLVTYRKVRAALELVCHQCQTAYDYPTQCPACQQTDIVSKYGAIEDLAETLAASGARIYRLDLAKTSKKIISPRELQASQQVDTFLTTRLFDPSLKYAEFGRIIFVNAENLLAAPDYLVQEETVKNLAELFLQVTPETEIVFDTLKPNSPLMASIATLGASHPNRQTIFRWYRDFLIQENHNRQTFGFPPHKNLLLLTTQEKQPQAAFDKLKQVQLELRKYLPLMPELEISSPYPARFFRRKNLYSQHLLVKYPRGYAKFAQLREIVTNLADSYRLQIRLNPRHLF